MTHPVPPPDFSAEPTRKGPLRRFLNGLYLLGGMLSAICTVALLVVIVAQMVARWSGLMFPGGAEYAGYLMAASSFLAFAYALNEGAHIRVGLVLNLLGENRHWGELFGLGLGSIITSYMAWYAVRLVQMSHKLRDVSQGQDATPLWIPQSPMAVGAILLAICFIDNFLTLIFTGTSPVASRELEGNELRGEI